MGLGEVIEALLQLAVLILGDGPIFPGFAGQRFQLRSQLSVLAGQLFGRFLLRLLNLPVDKPPLPPANLPTSDSPCCSPSRGYPVYP